MTISSTERSEISLAILYFWSFIYYYYYIFFLKEDQWFPHFPSTVTQTPTSLAGGEASYQRCLFGFYFTLLFSLHLLFLAVIEIVRGYGPECGESGVCKRILDS